MDSKVNILLQTTADVSGVEKLNTLLGHVAKSEKDLAQASKAVTQETKLQAEAMKRCADAAANTQKFFTPAAVNPWVTASANARVNLDNVSASQTRVAGASRNMGNALLQASRGLQDMQYGLAGAVNNLEGIASALGLGAGVAGVVTVLAVAVQTLGPGVVAWFKSLDTESVKLKAVMDGLEQSSEAIKGSHSGNADNAKRISDAFIEALKKEDDALKANTEVLNQNYEGLKRRANIQKTADQQKLDSDIEDIKAQRLSPKKERAAIAARKRQALDADRARQEQLASGQVGTAADQITKQSQARDVLKAKQAALEKEKDSSVEFYRLQDDQAKLEAKAKESARVAGVEKAYGNRPEVIAAAEEKRDRDAKALAENKARQKEIIAASPAGNVRKTDLVQADIDQVKPKAQAAEEQVRELVTALQALVQAERENKVGRENTYQREAEKIAREQSGGIFSGGNLSSPAQGLGSLSAPLPTGGAPGMELPDAPFGVQALNPQRAPSVGPFTPFGPGAGNVPESQSGGPDLGLLPGGRVTPTAKPKRDLYQEEKAAADKISSSNDAVNEGIVRLAETVLKSNEETLKRINEIDQKLRDQGVMS